MSRTAPLPGSMRMEQFAAENLYPRGFDLERNDPTNMVFVYRHRETGVLVQIECDEGPFRMSSMAVNVARLEIGQTLVRIELLLKAQRAERERIENMAKAAEAEANTRRVCRDCGEAKPLEEFQRNIDGETRKTICRDCMKKRVARGRRLALVARNGSDTTIATPPDSLEPAAGDSMPTVANAPAGAPTALPVPSHEAILFEDFVTQPEDSTPRAFAADDGRFIIVRIAGALYVLAPDGGPGEQLSERSLAYVLRLLSQHDIAGLRGVLYY